MRKLLKRLPKVVSLVALAIVVAWLCWPGRFSYFNMWLIWPGMGLEQVEWLMGEASQELTEEQVPMLQTGKRVVTGEKFYEWHDPASRFSDSFIVSFEGGVVKETWYWEEPLS